MSGTRHRHVAGTTPISLLQLYRFANMGLSLEQKLHQSGRFLSREIPLRIEEAKHSLHTRIEQMTPHRTPKHVKYVLERLGNEYTESLQSLTECDEADLCKTTANFQQILIEVDKRDSGWL